AVGTAGGRPVRPVSRRHSRPARPGPRDRPAPYTLIRGRADWRQHRSSAAGALLSLGDGPSGVDQAYVTERLREVADHFAVAGVDLSASRPTSLMAATARSKVAVAARASPP